MIHGGKRNTHMVASLSIEAIFLTLLVYQFPNYGQSIVQEEAWAAGGSGILLKTTNRGKTWSRDKAADNIAANLYSVKSVHP